MESDLVGHGQQVTAIVARPLREAQGQGVSSPRDIFRIPMLMATSRSICDVRRTAISLPRPRRNDDRKATHVTNLINDASNCQIALQRLFWLRARNDSQRAEAEKRRQ